MNGKQAKKLRKEAIKMAASLVEQGHTIHHDSHVNIRMKDKADKLIDEYYSKHSDYPFEFVTSGGTEVNRIDSLRGIYRNIKKSK